MDWFRFWKRTLNNAKVQRLPGDTFKAWINILCVACDEEKEGHLPGLEGLAFAIRLSTEQAKGEIDRLVAAELLDRDPFTDSLSVHDWDQWQPPWDNPAARMRKHRQGKKKKGENVTVAQPLRNGYVPESESESEERQRQKKTSSPKPPSKGETTTTEEYPEYPDENGVFVIMPGEHEHDEADARKIWGAIWKAWKKKKLCFEFYQHQRWLSMRAWEWAITEAVSKGQLPGTIKYLETIGHEGEAKGFERPRPVKRGQVGIVPYRPTSATDDEPQGKIYGAKPGP